jgi:hypothetical protein
MHSVRSDGAFEPEEVLDRCFAGGLDVIALTDHDLATEIRAGVHERGDRRVHVLHGAEVSGVHEGVEYHLLTYFPGEIPETFRGFCAERSRERAVRYEQAIDRLQLPGLTRPDAAARSGTRALTRFHLAQELVSAGHAANRSEAFAKFAGPRAGHVPNVDLTFLEAIRVARECGAVTSWAHPPLDGLHEHVATFAAAGLHGLEAIRPIANTRLLRESRRMARRHNLIVTAGSDWHGWGEAALGVFYARGAELRGFRDALAAA